MLFPKPSRPLQERWGEGEERQGGPWEAGVACVTGPFGAAGWGGDKTVVNKRSGRTRKTGENGTDKGDACSFLTQVALITVPTLRALGCPPQYPPCGPLALESLSLPLAPMPIPAVPFSTLDWGGSSSWLRPKPTNFG